MIYLRTGFREASSYFKWVQQDNRTRAAVMLPASRDAGFMAKRRQTIMKAARTKNVVVWGDPQNVVLFKTWARQEGVEVEEDNAQA